MYTRFLKTFKSSNTNYSFNPFPISSLIFSFILLASIINSKKKKYLLVKNSFLKFPFSSGTSFLLDWLNNTTSMHICQYYFEIIFKLIYNLLFVHYFSYNLYFLLNLTVFQFTELINIIECFFPIIVFFIVITYFLFFIL